MPKSLQVFAAENGVRRGPTCALKDNKHRKGIEDGLKAGIPATVISRWLQKEHGIAITATVLSRHKRGDCRCRA